VGRDARCAVGVPFSVVPKDMCTGMLEMTKRCVRVFRAFEVAIKEGLRACVVQR